MIDAAFDWPAHLKKALDATEFMALATQGDDGLWNQAVYFAYDQELNFYFISQPGSRHMNNIATNGEAALAIFSTSQAPIGDVIGLQVRGRAVVVPDTEVVLAHQIYFARSPQIPGIPTESGDYTGSAASWRFVKVTPEEVGYFDTKNFGDQRQTAPKGVKL